MSTEESTQSETSTSTIVNWHKLLLKILEMIKQEDQDPASGSISDDFVVANFRADNEHPFGRENELSIPQSLVCQDSTGTLTMHLDSTVQEKFLDQLRQGIKERRGDSELISQHLGKRSTYVTAVTEAIKTGLKGVLQQLVTEMTATEVETQEGESLLGKDE